MDKDRLTEAWIEMIWQHSVLPFVEEHFFGEPDRLKEFELNRLRFKSDGETETMPDNPATSEQETET